MIITELEEKDRPAKGLASGLLRLMVIVMAAIAVVLPWSVSKKYSALVKWFRDLLMHNNTAIRRWGLDKRWKWGSDETQGGRRERHAH